MSHSSSNEHYDEEIKNKILEASLPFVSEMGWSSKAIIAGAQTIGYPGITHGLFQNGGADLVNYFQKRSNLELLVYLKEKEKQQLEVPIPPAQFVEDAIRIRLTMIVPYINRWPQAIALMSLPQNVPNALATLLTTVDDICYYAGDKTIDFNWYVRRLGVAGIYKATELYLVQDKSSEHNETWKFLNRRMTEVVQIYGLLRKTENTSNIAKDVVMSAFVTARNILGISWTR